MLAKDSLLLDIDFIDVKKIGVYETIRLLFPLASFLFSKAVSINALWRKVPHFAS